MFFFIESPHSFIIRYLISTPLPFLNYNSTAALQKLNLLILFSAQIGGYINAPIMVFILPLISARLVDNPQWTTVPVAVMIVGLALSVSPANMLMRLFGRKKGYWCGSAFSMAAGATGCAAVVYENFSLLCVAAFFAGNSAAFVQSFRFAAAENASPDRTGRAVGLILLGGVLGGGAGAPLANYLHDSIADAPFAASWLVLIATGAATFLIFCFYRQLPAAAQEAPRLDPVGVWWRDIKLWGYALCGGGSYAIMTLLMTATPLSMHNHHGHSLSETAWVIQSHVIAMFLPSFFSGRLIDRFGAAPVILAGLAAFAGTALAAAAGESVNHYWLALVLLGIGWNFVFVGATMLTAQHATGATRFRAQALNDVIVFSLQGLAALTSGALLALLGWRDLNFYAFAGLCLLALVIVGLLRRSLPQQALR